MAYCPAPVHADPRGSAPRFYGHPAAHLCLDADGFGPLCASNSSSAAARWSPPIGQNGHRHYAQGPVPHHSPGGAGRRRPLTPFDRLPDLSRDQPIGLQPAHREQQCPRRRRIRPLQVIDHRQHHPLSAADLTQRRDQLGADGKRVNPIAQLRGGQQPRRAASRPPGAGHQLTHEAVRAVTAPPHHRWPAAPSRRPAPPRNTSAGSTCRPPLPPRPAPLSAGRSVPPPPQPPVPPARPPGPRTPPHRQRQQTALDKRAQGKSPSTSRRGRQPNGGTNVPRESHRPPPAAGRQPNGRPSGYPAACPDRGTRPHP